MTNQRPVRTLLFSTLYPSSVRPGHGIFVETRLRELLGTGQVHTKVVAPVPWFFSTDPRYGDYARVASTPVRETWHDIDVQHPRYFLPPKVGMSIAPLVLYLGAKAALQRLLDEGFDFDVIDAHYYYPDGVAAALLARHFKKPVVVTARGSDINLIGNFAVPKLWMRWAANRAAASIGVAQALVQAMAMLGMPKDKLRFMPNGVDLQRFCPRPQQEARKELGWPDAPTLISVGNLVENKGHHLVIEALSRLPAWRLVIAGEGPERSALTQLVDRLGLAERVQFLGRVDQQQLATCYGAADILVLASSREGWPNVLLESMACGTPVVASAVGGVPEIVTSPIAGRMLTQRSGPTIATAVNGLFAHPIDRVGVRAHAAQCGWQGTTAAQLDLFNQLVSSPAGGQHA